MLLIVNIEKGRLIRRITKSFREPPHLYLSFLLAADSECVALLRDLVTVDIDADRSVYLKQHFTLNPIPPPFASLALPLIKPHPQQRRLQPTLPTHPTFPTLPMQAPEISHRNAHGGAILCAGFAPDVARIADVA